MFARHVGMNVSTYLGFLETRRATGDGNRKRKGLRSPRSRSLLAVNSLVNVDRGKGGKNAPSSPPPPRSSSVQFHGVAATAEMIAGFPDVAKSRPRDDKLSNNRMHEWRKRSLFQESYIYCRITRYDMKINATYVGARANSI